MIEAQPTFSIHKARKSPSTWEWVVDAKLNDFAIPFWYRGSSRKKCVAYIRDQYATAPITHVSDSVAA